MKAYFVTVPRSYTREQRSMVVDKMLRKFPKGSKFSNPGPNIIRYLNDPNTKSTVLIMATYFVDGREMLGLVHIKLSAETDKVLIEEG